MVEDTKMSIGGISSNEIQNTDWKMKLKKENSVFVMRIEISRYHQS